MKGLYLPSVSDWGVWRGTPLEVVGDNHSPAPIYVQQWDIVVLDRHLVVCVSYMFVCAVLVFSACFTVAICEVRCLART